MPDGFNLAKIAGVIVPGYIRIKKVCIRIVQVKIHGPKNGYQCSVSKFSNENEKWYYPDKVLRVHEIICNKEDEHACDKISLQPDIVFMGRYRINNI